MSIPHTHHCVVASVRRPLFLAAKATECQCTDRQTHGHTPAHTCNTKTGDSRMACDKNRRWSNGSLCRASCYETGPLPCVREREGGKEYGHSGLCLTTDSCSTSVPVYRTNGPHPSRRYHVINIIFKGHQVMGQPSRSPRTIYTVNRRAQATQSPRTPAHSTRRQNAAPMSPEPVLSSDYTR